MINESFVRLLFEGRDPVGHRVKLPHGFDAARFATVVGVVDLKYSKLDTNSAPEIYIPYQQSESLGTVTFVIQTEGDPLPAAPVMQKLILNIDKTVPVYDVKTMEQALTASIAPRPLTCFY